MTHLKRLSSCLLAILLVITLIQTLKQSLSLEDVGRLFAACPEFSGEGRYDAAAVHARYEDFERMKLSLEKLAEAIQENMKDCQAEDLFSQVLYLANLSGALSLTARRLIDTLPQPEKRLIHLSLSSQKGFLLLRVENYCEARLSFRDGLPVTTKGDENYHGFGLKSVRRTLEKYGGSLTVCQEDCWVEVKVLIPLPEGGVPPEPSSE